MRRGLPTALAGALLLCLVLGIATGCARQGATERTDPLVKVVATRSYIGGAYARPGGGWLALVITGEGYDWIQMLDAWDASATVPLGGPGEDGLSVAPTRDGVYVLRAGSLGYAPYGSTPRDLGVRQQFLDVWASRSGDRLLLEAYPEDLEESGSYLFTGRDGAGPTRTWIPGFSIANVTWLSESRLLVDTEDFGDQHILQVDISPDGSLDVTDTGLVGDGPSMSPDGSLWAYVRDSRVVVVYDPATGRDIARWSAGGTGVVESDEARSTTWADPEHIAVVVEDVDDYAVRMVVLDVSGALRQARR